MVPMGLSCSQLRSGVAQPTTQGLTLVSTGHNSTSGFPLCSDWKVVLLLSSLPDWTCPPMSPTSNWEINWSRWNNISRLSGNMETVLVKLHFLQAIEGSEGFAGVDWTCGTFDIVAEFIKNFLIDGNNVMTLSRNVAGKWTLLVHLVRLM